MIKRCFIMIIFAMSVLIVFSFAKNTKEIDKPQTGLLAREDNLSLYSSEEDYKKIIADSYLLAEEEKVETVKQKYKVLNYIDKTPISNVIIKFNNLSRFTDKDGEITLYQNKGTLQYINASKEDYLPYVEMFEVDGNDKIIYMKKPSDNIEIYQANLTYDGDEVNLINQVYSIDLSEEVDYEEYQLDIKANCNIDKCYIYQEEKVIFENNTGLFTGNNFKDYFQEGDNIYIRIVSHQVESKKIKLNLSFLDASVIDLGTILGIQDSPASSSSGTKKYGDTGLKITTGDPVFGGLEFDEFFQCVKQTLKLSKNTKATKFGKHGFKSKFGITFSIVHDNKKQATKIALGVSVDFNNTSYSSVDPKTGKTVVTKKDTNSLINGFKKSYNASRGKTVNQGNGKSVFESLKTAFKCPAIERSATGMHIDRIAKSIDFKIDLLGYVEIQDQVFTDAFDIINKGQEEEALVLASSNNAFLASEFNVADYLSYGVSLTFGFSLEHYYQSVFAIPVPPYGVPYYLSVGIEIKAGIEYNHFASVLKKELQDTIDLIISISTSIGGGVGIGKICGVGIYGKLTFSGTIRLNDYGFKYSLKINIGIKGKILLFGFDVPIAQFDIGEGKYGSFNEAVALACSTLTLKECSSLIETEEYLSGEDAQIVMYNGKAIKVYTGMSNSSDTYNNTKTFYSYLNADGTWSTPSTISNDSYNEYSPTLKVINDELYLTYMKSNSLFNSETTLGQSLASQDIYLAKYNDTLNTFEEITQITDNDYLDCNPSFSDSTSELEVIYQSNDLSDCFGITGNTTISKYTTEGTELLLQTTKPVISFSKNNDDLIYTLDMDANLDTVDDQMLFKNNIAMLEECIMIKNACSIKNYEGTNDVYYLTNSSIEKIDSEGNNTTIMTVSSLASNMNVSYVNNKLVLSYLLSNQSTGYKELYVSFFDSSLNSFSKPINISLGENIDITNYDIYDIKDNSIYFVTTSNCYNSDDVIINSIILNHEYRLGNDIVLNDVIAFDTLKAGENTVYASITNNGSYPLTSFKVTIDGVEKNIELDTPINQYESVIVPIAIHLEDDQDELNVSTTIEDDIDSSNNDILLNNLYSDFSLEVESELINNKQSFNILLENNLMNNEKVSLCILNQTTDEVLFEKEYDGLNEITEMVTLNEDSISNNDILVFYLKTTNEQFIEQAVRKQCYKEEIIVENEVINYLIDYLNIAKMFY